MTKLKIILLFLLSSFYSHGQNTGRHNTDPKARQLSNKITTLVLHLDDPDSCRLALMINPEKYSSNNIQAGSNC